MSQAGDVLRMAAADVEVRGVLRLPKNGETCALYALQDHSHVQTAPLDTYWATINLLHGAVGTESVSEWNDSQPSRAVVAAEMRSAADLADLLYGGDAE